MRRSLTGMTLIVFGAIGCAVPGTAPAPATSAIAACHPKKAVLRADVEMHWKTLSGEIDWPPGDGLAAQPATFVLPPGTALDRFGDDCGRFFSPTGLSFHARSLPYICAPDSYHSFVVVKPFAVLAGRAVAHFGEPGGGTTYKSEAPVALLLANHVIEPVPSPGPAPCD